MATTSGTDELAEVDVLRTQRPAAAEPPDGPARGFSPQAIAAITTLAVGLILLVEVFLAPAAPWGGVDNPGAFHPPRSRAEHLVAKMDGHTFAATAMDPTMAHAPDSYFGDRADAAYRSSRPVQGWVDLVASAGGQRSLLAPAILVLTAVGLGAAVLSVADLGRASGRRIRWLGLVAATPAGIAAVAYPGICEPLAIALACWGIAAWLRDRPWEAVALLTAAALTRETMVVVPLGLGLAHLIERRTPIGAIKLAVPAVAYGAWIVIVHARIGAWPSDYAQTGDLLAGFQAGFPHWHLAEWAAALLLVGSAAVVAVRGTTWMRAIAVLYVPLLAVANHQVWWVWLGFGRVAVLLPVFALIALGTPIRSSAPAVGADPVDPSDQAEAVAAGSIPA
ncbi:hypothetical protein [Aquihabitans sp. McL0605]|uniref:hypothetical protein n=1 Tax=Aquihabitans sp. McL0605 TaxID=3415671 RepID=UPI003CF44375